jgi:hypothetical protein
VRRFLLASLLSLAACNFEHGSLSGGPREAGADDASDAPLIDAMIDGPSPLCYGRSPFTVCLTMEPSSAIVFTSSIETTGCTYNMGTGQGELITANGTSLCVVAGATIDMIPTNGTSIGTSGSRPLVLIAAGDLNVPSGTRLDASSATNNVVGVPTGPGFNPSECGNKPSGASSTSGGGGGAGGTFGTKGGNGGAGGGATAGTAAQVPSPFIKLRGGCPGGDGGNGSSMSAAGGPGGGAIALFSHAAIQIDGTVTASGAAGEGGNAAKGGAGGGGSGGMILLHANTIMMGTNGKLIANGGGGGAGAGQSTSGDNGQDASQINTAASGGTFSSNGCTPGGAGAFGTTGAVTPQPGSNGGPGGGGGVGVIRVLSGQSLPASKVSPPPV